MSFQSTSSGKPGTIEQAELNEVLALEKDLAGLLLDWSWEGTVGFEERLEKVAAAYGYEDATAVVDAQSAFVQIEGRQVIAKCSIPDIPPLAALPKVKLLFLDIFGGKLTPTEAQDQIRSIRESPAVYPFLLRLLGTILLAIGFSVDVVGTWEGMVVAALTAIPAGLCMLTAGRLEGFNRIAGLVGTALSGIIAMLLWKFGYVTAAPGLLLISATFIFIPGDSITLQAYEMAMGRWSPAVDRLFYSIMQLVLQVAGAIFAAIVTVTAFSELFPETPGSDFAWWAIYPARVIFTLGNMWAFQMRVKDYVPALIIVFICSAAAQLGSAAYGEIVGSFVGMFVATILAVVYADGAAERSPAYVFLLTPVFALSPGSHGLRGFECWFTDHSVTGIQNLSTLVGVLLAMAIGLLLAAFCTRGFNLPVSGPGSNSVTI